MLQTLPCPLSRAAHPPHNPIRSGRWVTRALPYSRCSWWGPHLNGVSPCSGTSVAVMLSYLSLSTVHLLLHSVSTSVSLALHARFALQFELRALLPYGHPRDLGALRLLIRQSVSRGLPLSRLGLIPLLSCAASPLQAPPWAPAQQDTNLAAEDSCAR